MTVMAHIKKSNYQVWHQRENIIENILKELECTETEHFRYWLISFMSNKYKI